MEKFSWATPYFPNSLVRALPIFAQPIEHALSVLPPLIRNCMSVFIGKIHGVHHLAIDIELRLLVCGIANAYRPLILVARKMIQRDLIELLSAIKPIHDLQGAALRVVTQATFQPFDKGFGFINET
jgi:hypothetical protein